MGGGEEGDQKGKGRLKIRDIIVDEKGGRRGPVGAGRRDSNSRDRQAALDFLSTTDVGRLVPSPAEEDGQCGALEWELREGQRREEERRLEAADGGGGGGGVVSGNTCSSSPPSVVASAGEG